MKNNLLNFKIKKIEIFCKSRQFKSLVPPETKNIIQEMSIGQAL